MGQEQLMDLYIFFLSGSTIWLLMFPTGYTAIFYLCENRIKVINLELLIYKSITANILWLSIARVSKDKGKKKSQV
jgi:hypothetical protein